MLYLVAGIPEKRKSLIHSLIPEGMTPQHIFDNDISEKDFLKSVSTQPGLFGDKELYVLHNLCRTLDLKHTLKVCAESENIFIFSEESITKKIHDEFSKHTEHIKDFGLIPKKEDKGFNIFALTDALGNRDKKYLWTLFQAAHETSSPEEIHGVLFWQIKNLALVAFSEGNPGLKPFVYSKNKTFLKNYTKQEILSYAQLFTDMFHERDTYSSLNIELEKFILSL